MPETKINKQIKELQESWDQRAVIHLVHSAKTKKEQAAMREELEMSADRIKEVLNDIKAPLKAISQLKKVAEAYLIEAEAELTNTQLSIFDY